MRVADYIAQRLSEAGVRDAYMVSGGGMMFLSDGLYHAENIRTVCVHHEQAAAMAAVGSAKYSNRPSAVYTSTGCGATNAITGLLHAWQDSVPVIFVSGQVKQRETVRCSSVDLRQFGTQEADIVTVVESLTKYAVMVTDPEDIAYHVDRAIHLALHGRKGPVWLDIPMDVQGTEIDPSKLHRFSPDGVSSLKEAPTAAEITAFKTLLANAERPVVIAGQGVRLAGACDELKEFIERLQIPVVAPYLGVGVLDTCHPLYTGVIGIKGSRAGNLAVQNSDLLIVLGSRLSVTAIGYEYQLFAREAKRVVVDIDPVEHKKKTININQLIQSDVLEFLKSCNEIPGLDTGSWVDWCQGWKKKYPACTSEHRSFPDAVSMYHFVDTLTRLMSDDAVVISDAGSAFYVVTQAINLKGGQRYITSGGQAEMGYTLPACVGVSVARNDGEVLGITGDGSFQMNIQELQTIAYERLPVKIFVFNNNGYLSIRATQTKFFEGRLIGTDASSGLSLPNLEKVAYAYGLAYRRCESSAGLEKDLCDILAQKGPMICEVMCRENEPVIPTAASVRKDDGTMESRPLEDMMPFLDRDEYRRNLFVKPIDEED